MKIVIAYDGSESADIAIDGLQRAGLPSENVDALVVSIGEVWLPPSDVVDDTFPSPPGLREARERAAHANPGTGKSESVLLSELMVLPEHSPLCVRLRSGIGPKAARSASSLLTM